MINIVTLPLGNYQTNCYIVYAQGSDRCAVIDPGFEPETVLQQTAALGLTIDAILLTHGHFDHVGGVKEICRSTGCGLWIHRDDQVMTGNPTTRFFYPLSGQELANLQFCEEGQVLPVAGLEFTVLSTPGHTNGSVCYRCEDALFSGDTLFAGSCGRTDLPGGNYPTICASLARLAQLPQDLRVFPGHGGSSTIGREKQTNPYL